MPNIYLEQGARGENRWWRYLATLALIGGAVLVFNIVYSILLVVCAKAGMFEMDLATGKLSGMPAPLFALGLLSFAGVLGALALGVRKVHRRPFSTLLGAGTGFEARGFALAAVVSFALLTGAMALWSVIDPGALLWNESAGFWPAALAFALMVPIQASTEELLYRGWLSQGLARLTRKRWVPVAVSSVLFAAPHLANPEVSGTTPLVAFGYYLLFGVGLSLITLRTGRLELAMGLHTGWNLCAFLIASPKNTHFAPVSLWITRDAVTVIDFLLVPAVIALTTVVVARAQTRRAAVPLSASVSSP